MALISRVYQSTLPTRKRKRRKGKKRRKNNQVKVRVVKIGRFLS